MQSNSPCMLTRVVPADTASCGSVASGTLRLVARRPPRAERAVLGRITGTWPGWIHVPLLAAAMLATTLFGCPLCSQEPPPADVIGRVVRDFTLTDSRGREHRLSDYHHAEVVVLAFLGTECPLARRYSLRLNALQDEYRDRGVTILGIDPNSQDSLREIGAFANRLQLTLPLLKDEAQRVADSCGATRTPEVFVLDAERRIQYFGRVDDQYGIGFVRSNPGHRDLREAIDDLLAQRPVAQGHQPAPGCLIGRDRPDVADAEITYCGQIARILNQHCVECHRDGEIAPMALTEYQEVAGWAEMIDEVVREQRMPPWHADPDIGQFANDGSLSPEEKSLVARWVAAGAPEGDPAQRPDSPTFTTGWQLPREPDVVVKMRDTPFVVPAEGKLEYRYFRVDPGWSEDRWISAAEIRPGNRSVVHHVLIFARPKGSRRLMQGERGFLVGFVPGSRVRPFPTGMAKRVPANSELVFQVHYTPVGTEEQDLTSVGFVFADPESITHEVHTTSAVQVRLRIPPGEPDYRATAMLPEQLPECTLLSLSPHMHLRGKSFRFTLVLPDGTRQPQLNVPHYDFNWQTAYWLSEPRSLPAGTRVFCEAVFDNSEGNLNNPDPTRLVRWGDQTDDEMMIGYFDVVVPRSTSWQAP